MLKGAFRNICTHYLKVENWSEFDSHFLSNVSRNITVLKIQHSETGVKLTNGWVVVKNHVWNNTLN